MSLKELLIILPAVFKFGTNVFKGFKNAKKKKQEKKFIKAVRSGDVDAINRWLHS